MGFRTVVILNNDSFDVLSKHSQEFFQEVGKRMTLPHRGTEGAFGLGSHYPVATIVECVHTSATSIAVIKGLSARVLGRPLLELADADEDEQLFRKLADTLGYAVRKKPRPR